MEHLLQIVSLLILPYHCQARPCTIHCHIIAISLPGKACVPCHLAGRCLALGLCGGGAAKANRIRRFRDNIPTSLGSLSISTNHWAYIIATRTCDSWRWTVGLGEGCWPRLTMALTENMWYQHYLYIIWKYIYLEQNFFKSIITPKFKLQFRVSKTINWQGVPGARCLVCPKYKLEVYFKAWKDRGPILH